MSIETRLRAAFAALAIAATSTLGAQSEPEGRFGLLLTDGTFVLGEPMSLEPEGGELRFRSAGEGAVESVPLDRLVGLSGPTTAEPEATVLVRLVGGDELRGTIGAGDVSGETIVVRTAALGSRAIRVDRLESVRFLDNAGPDRNASFAVPSDVEEDEALFLPARRGFDVVVGFVHRFREDGVLFQARGEDEPRVWPYTSLAGFALRDGDPRPEPPGALLLTAAGDRVGVDWVGLEDGEFAFRLEEGDEARLRAAEVASLSMLGDQVVHLSDVPVADARERPYFDDGNVPLWPYRRDRSVTGGALRAAGLGFAKGIGVHSHSALAWKVPEGVSALVGLVGLDDSALDLPVRGSVAVRIRLGDEVLFEAEEIAAGAAPRALGRLPVRAGETLWLEIDFGPGLDLGDRADWLGVAFVR